MLKKYFPKNFEKKWQDKWEDGKIYQALNDSDRSKKYILDMFPYPSGDGLHVGHFKGYVASDIISRYYRLKGYNVLHPMGWDAFGLPAENYAIKTGIHPKLTTVKNVSNIKKQMQEVGLSYDWSREIDTTDPNYYKWTQWIFLKLFEHGLAYEDEVPINWCPKDKTGLANEEVVNGACERCGTKVERKVIRQWILRITKYADRLIEDLEGLDWPEFIKEMQVNWIGRSEGTRFKFEVEYEQSKDDSEKDYIEVFTTRIDTVFGVTAVVLGPEHPLVEKLTKDENKESVEAYINEARNKSDLERTELNKEKTGVFTGSYVINPINMERVPVWVADYVLGFYGTGAVMVVPAHDARDFEFAKKYDLPIKPVVEIKGQEVQLPFTGSGLLVNSGQYDGMGSNEAKKAITNYLKDNQKGDFEINYKLRDWLFSRQRYWGEPIPLVHCEKDGIVPIPESELPLKLPETEKYEPTGTGESPLASITDWVNTTCPKCGGRAKRETNTMPQWAGSCWYYLRFCDPKNRKALISKDIEKYWLSVDWYIGGAEHAVLHLLYSRFWHKFLFDIKSISTIEPFQKLTSVGLVLAEDGQKMSKSKGNVVRPETIINNYGADTLRVYESFMGPFDNTISWDPGSINGVYRFLTRVWDLVLGDDLEKEEKRTEVALGRLVRKVGEDIENMKFNTSVAAMMEFLNLAAKNGLTKEQKKKFLIVLAPFAPHTAEELFQESSGESRESSDSRWSVHQQKWPDISEDLLIEEEVVLVVQVNGKFRDSFRVSKNISEAEMIEKAMKSEKVSKFLTGEIKKAIFVPGKILNIVV